MTTVIQVENLSKRYRLGQIGGATLRDDIHRWWAKARNKPNPLLKVDQQHLENGKNEYIWALKDINLTVQQGEVLGIIGRNGAGKSTLLKILSRVTAPTTGVVKVKGRVASLLEVGTGFHHQLTGRENIYLNGSILGMKKIEIDRKFDEIVAFSGVEQFIDTPVKRYSSGMYVRLAFAVAAHLDPENLIVDEVLAVGDAEFQRKCLGKMGEVARGGRTVLFVSHNMTAIKSLCGRAMLLNRGLIVDIGESTKIVEDYLSLNQRQKLEQSWHSVDQAPGNEKVRVMSVSLNAMSPTDNNIFTVETPLELEFKFWIFSPTTINLSMHLKHLGGETVFASRSPDARFEEGIAEFSCQIHGNLLNDGIYSITMMIVKNGKALFVLNDAIIFQINDTVRKDRWLGKWPGAVRPQLNWEYKFQPSTLNNIC